MRRLKFNANRVTKTLLKRFLLLMLFGVGFYHYSSAQISLSLQNGSGSYANGEDLCMQMIVDDFTDFTAVSFAIEWNPSVLEFTGVDDFAVPDLSLSAANFDLSNVQNGILSFNWESISGDGITIPTRSLADLVSIFELCFRTSENCGGSTEVSILRGSISSVRSGGVIIDDFDTVEDAAVNVAGTPVTITISQATANPEEIVCVSVLAESFKEMESAQFSIRWDPTTIRFNDIEPNPEFPLLSSASFNIENTEQGFIVLSWFDNAGLGVSVPDNTNMFDLCFEVLSAGGEVGVIEFSNDPTPIEFGTISEGVNACNILNDGRLFINEEVGEVTIKSSSESVKPGDAVCVDVAVTDFVGVTSLDLSLAWDASILQFDSLQNFMLRGLGINNFNLTAANSGSITLRWSDDNGVVFPPTGDRTIFTLCFTAIGPVGSSSRIQFADAPQPPTVGKPNNPDAGLNTRSGTVTILPAESLNLSVSSATVSPAQDFCVQVLADNFVDILNLDYSMGWETSLIEFRSITAFGLAGLDETDFDLTGTGAGFLSMSWASETFEGETLENGSVLYEICFSVKDNAQLGLCNSIFFTDIPDPIRAITTNSNGFSIDVTDQGNDICIFQPDGFSVFVGESDCVKPDSTICIPITVSNFDSLNSMQFSLNWNPSIFQFEAIQNLNPNLPGFSRINNFNDVLAELGIASVTWSTNDCVSLEDDAVIFELCLKAVGERLSKTALEISGSPLPYEVTSCKSGNTNVSLNPINATVEVCDALEIIAFPIMPSCGNTEDGILEVLVNGGSGNYDYVWDIEPIQTGPILIGLQQGTFTVTVTDRDVPDLNLVQSFELIAMNQAPVADAGEDRNLSCGDQSATLGGINNETGPNISYSWSKTEDSDGNLFLADRLNALVTNGGGTFILEVSSDSTGCSSVDTVLVTVSDEPIVSAGEDAVITCAEQAVTLDATEGTQMGEEVSYRWFTLDNAVIEGDTTSLTPTAVTAGRYVLVVSHENGCFSSDTVQVTDIREIVEARAGNNQTLNCTGDPVILDGSNSTVDSMSARYTAEWFATGNTEPFATGYIASVQFPDTFALVVTDNITGCTGVDTVIVSPDTELPVINLNAIDQIDCNTSEVALNIRINNVDTFNVQWLPPVPLDQRNELNPIVSQAGTYEVIVTNAETGCSATRSDIVVTEDFDTPVANIATPNQLGCAETASVFLLSDDSSTGDIYASRWFGSDGLFVRTVNETTAEVFEVGIYYLEVTNINTGCTALDSVVVRGTASTPQVNIVLPTPIACDAETTQIDGSLSVGTEFLWTILEGDFNIVNGITEPIATVDGPGLIELRVTNAEGCIAADTILIEQATTEDVIFGLDLSGTDLTCTVSSVLATITDQPNNSDYIYTWIRDSVATSLNGPTESLTEPGLYILQVTDRGLNCTREELFVINQDTELSVPVISNDPSSLVLDCIDDGVTLDATATEPTPIEIIRWVGPDGEIVETDTPLLFDATESGTYTMVISNPENGCTDSTSVAVSSASDVEAIIEEPAVLTCRDSLVLLNGFDSTDGQDIVYEWTDEDGNVLPPNNPASSAFVNTPGIYTLTVINTATECDASTSVTVTADQELPMVDAGDDLDLGCGDDTALDGSNSDSGENFTYNWQLNGESIGTEAQVSINAPGVYDLLVTNETSGCVGSDQVVVTQQFDLPTPDAGIDETTCDNITRLTGVNPNNARGIWTSLGTAMPRDSANPEAIVDGLVAGENLFVWTLSTMQCPSYASDTVSIFVESTPDANDDVASYVVSSKLDSITIKVTANDLISNIMWNSAIIARPKIGTIISYDNGTAVYTARTINSGQDDFRYELCNANCPALCDTATVRVNIEVIEDEIFEAPNAITPNGDGQNDQLRFQVLESNIQFPDNSFSVYNRWGDLVYEAAPYANDWEGTSNDGTELPAGTYYYILRLDIANGQILQGDVTIIK